ncbi:MAG TPA: PAS domain-containing protein [Verrucomicrobiae bacterium]|nr:PAS domain-containing protein [Verrucomicrobiae bacterium]
MSELLGREPLALGQALSNASSAHALETRSLLLLPLRRDALLCQTLLREAGLEAYICADVRELHSELQLGAATVLTTDDQLVRPEAEPLFGFLAQQPRWSDLPVLILTRPEYHSPGFARVLLRLENAVLLSRPVDADQVLSAIRSALKARRRQYQVRDFLAERERVAAQLRESQDRLLLATDAAQLGTWDWDIGTRRLLWSPRCLALFGLAPDVNLNYEDFLNAVHPEDRDRVSLQVRTALHQRSDFATEFRCVWPDCSTHWVASRGRGYYDSSGYPVRMSGMAFDITRQKEIENALRLSEQRYRSYVEATSNVVWRMNAEGEVDEPIPSWNLFTGQSDQQAAGLGWMDAVHPEDRPAVEAAWRSACENHSIYQVQYRLRMADGQWRYILARGVPVFESDGAVREYIGVCIDITAQRQAEQALLRSEQTYRAFFHQAAVGIGRVDFKDGRWLEVNDAFCEMLGYSREFLCATPSPQITHPDDLPIDLDQFQRMAAGELDSYTVEKRLKHHDGHYLWARLTLSIVRDADGRPDYEIAIVENIEDRKRAEGLLQRQASLIDLSPTATIVRTVEGTITFWSAGATALYGWAPHKAIGQISHALLETEFPVPLEQITEHLLTKGPWIGELRHRTKSGAWVTVESHWLGQFSPDGRTLELLESNMDISARKAAEFQLGRDLKAMRCLQQVASLFVLQGNLQPVFEEFVHAAITIADADFANVQLLEEGSRLRMVAQHGFPPAYIDFWNNLSHTQGACGSALASGKRVIVHDVELSPIFAGQTALEFQRLAGVRAVQSTPLLSRSGKPLGMLSTHFKQPHTPDDHTLRLLDLLARQAADIIERAQSDQALVAARDELARANAHLDRTVQERTAKLQDTISELEGFSYSLVHDMRAPLRAMISYAEILSTDAGDRLKPDETDLLRKVGLAARRMDHLITDSLNYSKILRQDLPLGPIDLGPLLRGMVETYPNLHPPLADVLIEFDRLLVHGNEAALIQIFSNLLGNAVKFVAPGVHPRVRVYTETQPCPDALEKTGLSCAFVYVHDNGIGIPKNAHDKIFAMFARLHRAETYPGTGIGLAMVKKSLERTGGWISLESEPGKGSRFCVQLPLA